MFLDMRTEKEDKEKFTSFIFLTDDCPRKIEPLFLKYKTRKCVENFFVSDEGFKIEWEFFKFTKQAFGLSPVLSLAW